MKGPLTGFGDKPIAHVSAPTEERNPRTATIDRLPTLDVLRLINDEDRAVADAVRAVLPDVARAADLAVEAIRSGRRVHYVGAGTSGRLGVLDAAELVPTFATPEGWFVTHHAGGPAALLRAAEDVEDDAGTGRRELLESAEEGDLVVGLTASGRTPYVLGGLQGAKERAASTVLVTANPYAEFAEQVDVFVGIDTGPEVVTGSTRMKAGTAQKLVLNAFSTAVMVRLGRTYSNLMVDMVATNAKLRGRTLRILVDATKTDHETCARVLAESDGELKTALVSVLSGMDAGEARRALAQHDGHVHAALESLNPAGGAA